MLERGGARYSRPFAFTPDGKRLIRLRTFDGQFWTRNRGGRALEPLAFSPDGECLLSGGGDLRLWSLETARIARIFPSISGVTHVAFDPSGTRFAAGTLRQLTVWGRPDPVLRTSRDMIQ